ncbi:MAG TPA: bestrophin family ion channel, partial [Pirellulales bacterium]|nr:bestrophin family ion channel [Pirellulales bacterium]
MTRSLSAGFEFWRDLFTFSGAAGRLVFWRVLIFGAFATAVWQIEIATETSIAVDLTPYEVVGAALSLLLVLRTNAGYDRWWEARKLWGGIVNQSRDLAVAALAYGPADRAWREQVVRWTIAFAHATRRSLRDERVAPELVSLLGPAQAGR